MIVIVFFVFNFSKDKECMTTVSGFKVQRFRGSGFRGSEVQGSEVQGSGFRGLRLIGSDSGID